jgi:hypothetical protein
MLLMAGSIMHQQGKFQQMAGDVIPFPPSPNTPLGRKQIREELKAGMKKYNESLPPPTHPPITFEDIKSRIPDE